MTEYEINKAVAEKLEIMQYMFDGKDSGHVIWNVPSNNLYNGFVSSRGNLFDPCNNAQQAWEIIYNFKIDISFGDDVHPALKGCTMAIKGDKSITNEKPFVAAMLLFLEI